MRNTKELISTFESLEFRDMGEEIFGYRKLVAYQKAKDIVTRTYKLLEKLPADERYAMCDNCDAPRYLLLLLLQRGQTAFL